MTIFRSRRSVVIAMAGLLITVSPLSVAWALAQDDKGEIPALIQPASASAAPAAMLVLDQAIAWALEHSPVLGASTSRADAATASRSQAGALPNPELSIEAENIYGDGPLEGTHEMRWAQ